MNNQEIIPCSHDHIIKIGENKKTRDKYDYCLNCGERVRKNFYHCLVLDATYYLEEYPVETENERQLKVYMIQKRFQQMMLETGIAKPEFLINCLKKEVEEKRKEMVEVKNKMLLKVV